MENKRVPELRFKGFNDDWELCKLGDVSEALEYGLNAPSKNFDGTHKYIRITDIDDTSHKFKQDGLTSPDIDIEILEYYKVQEGDILFARTGASVGKSYHYSLEDGLVYYAGFLIKARIKNEFSSEFIFQNTLTSNYDNFIKITSQRSGQPGINANEYSNYKIMIPKYNEQQKIGEFFYQFDNAIELHQRKLDRLKQLKEAYLESLFPSLHSFIPKLRLKNYQDDWKSYKLGNLFLERTERSAKGELLSVTIKSGVLRASELTKVDNSSADKSNYKKVNKGDIVYNSMRMWQGASGYSSYEGIVSPAYTVLIPNKNVDSLFFSYMFKKYEMIKIFEKNSQGLTSDTWNLKFPALSSIKVKIPSYSEQQEISSLLLVIDESITINQKKIKTLANLKQAYLQKMFV